MSFHRIPAPRGLLCFRNDFASASGSRAVRASPEAGGPGKDPPFAVGAAGSLDRPRDGATPRPSASLAGFADFFEQSEVD